MYRDHEIRQLPLTVAPFRRQVESFLAISNLRLDAVDYYAGVFSCSDNEMLAGGGLKGNVIKCLAVSQKIREEGIASLLVSHLISTAYANGHQSVKVFTKPENADIFKGLGFTLLAQTEKAVLLENGLGLAHYRQYLESLHKKTDAESCRSGVIVMNANPLTLGHRYLIEYAATQVDRLYLIAVREDSSEFSYSERLAMLNAATQDLPDVVVCEGSDYAVSAATFPTYFLKELSEAADTQIELDLELFLRHIAPALGASIRFVGSEPTDSLTRRYNERMKEILSGRGIEVREIPRLQHDGVAVSASLLRRHIAEGSFLGAVALAYRTTVPYILSHLAKRALQKELDTTPKPGLVDRKDNGAHSDMDYAMMQRSINALQPYFLRLALLGSFQQLPQTETVQRIGMEGEEAMLQCTGGVNTHRGALFSLGLTIVAASHLFHKSPNSVLEGERLEATIASLAHSFPRPEGTHGSKVEREYNVGGALESARNGYRQLFSQWLPFYQANLADEYVLQKTMLLIMATLNDTNIYYRKGALAAADVRRQAEDLLGNFSISALEDMNRSFISDNLSPGGVADMLALTVFIHSLLN